MWNLRSHFGDVHLKRISDHEEREVLQYNLHLVYQLLRGGTHVRHYHQVLIAIEN